MLSADEAIKLTQQTWEEVQTIDELLRAEQAIKENAAKGFLVAAISGIPVPKAEKVAWELEEFGYFTGVINGRLDATGAMLVDVQINWKFRPASRADSSMANK